MSMKWICDTCGSDAGFHKCKNGKHTYLCWDCVREKENYVHTTDIVSVLKDKKV